jgi:SAM-dependent methyltransferase
MPVGQANKMDTVDPYEDFSAFYDLYVGGWLEDLPLYLEYARASSGPLLEIGAGSGRLTIPLARAGFSVTAVDVSPSMLSILESKLAAQPQEVSRRVHVVRADCCRLDLGDEFDLVIAPFYTFNYLLSAQDQDDALHHLLSHLRDGGRLLIDVFVPWNRIDRCPPDPVLRVDSLDSESGVRVRGWNTYSMDRANQFEYRTHLFEITEPPGNVTRREFVTKRHYVFPEQLEHAFSKAGLGIEEVFAGYKRARPEPRSEQLLYVLRKG